MAVQHIVVLGDPIRCSRCKGIATVQLSWAGEGEAHYSSSYCDECWIAETRAYQPLVSGDKRRATQEVERILGDDNEQKAGVRI